MTWSVDKEVPDLSGKTIVITGCTSGVGMHAAHQLLQRNASVVMACRNPDKMATVASTLRTKLHLQEQPDRIREIRLDVADLDSVRAFPTALRDASVTTVHALVLNAGISRSELARSPQGLELISATNIIGHWLLTGLMLPLLQKGAPHARVIAVSSQTHFGTSTIDYSLMRAEIDAATFNGLQAYMQSKLAALWFVSELNRHHLPKGVIALAAHPGYAQSEMTNPNSAKNPAWSQRITHILAAPFKQSGECGAWPISLAVGAESAVPDDYYGPTRLFGIVGPPAGESRRSAASRDIEKQAEFWRRCEEITGYRYPSPTSK